MVEQGLLSQNLFAYDLQSHITQYVRNKDTQNTFFKTEESNKVITIDNTDYKNNWQYL